MFYFNFFVGTTGYDPIFQTYQVCVLTEYTKRPLYLFFCSEKEFRNPDFSDMSRMFCL